MSESNIALIAKGNHGGGNSRRRLVYNQGFQLPAWSNKPMELGIILSDGAI
jgi:hypothetical protein